MTDDQYELLDRILEEGDEDAALDRMLTTILREPDDEALLVAIDCGIMPHTDYSRLKVDPDDTGKMFRLIYRGPDADAPEPEDEITKTQI